MVKQKQKQEDEVKEKEKTRREKLGGYFFNLSQLTFVASVLGTISPLFSDEDNNAVLKMALGVVATAIFAWIGNKILK